MFIYARLAFYSRIKLKLEFSVTEKYAPALHDTHLMSFDQYEKKIFSQWRTNKAFIHILCIFSLSFA